MAILVASTWLRVLVHLRLSFLVGPLLKMVVHMTKDILKFILLLIFILFAFASVGKIELPIPEFRVPDIGGANNAYFQVKARREWSKLFVQWLRDPHEREQYSDDEEEEAE